MAIVRESPTISILTKLDPKAWPPSSTTVESLFCADDGLPSTTEPPAVLGNELDEELIQACEGLHEKECLLPSGILRSGNAERTRKHRIQQVAMLLRVRERVASLHGRYIVVDVGGSGGELLWVYGQVVGFPAAMVVVDPEEPPLDRRIDTYFSQDSEACQRTRFVRLSKPIGDVTEKDLPCADLPLVMLGKHLCGSATDSLLLTVAGAPFGSRVVGLFVSQCCYMKIDPTTYVGRPYFQRIGITEEEFVFLCHKALWHDPQHSTVKYYCTLSRVGAIFEQALVEGRRRYFMEAWGCGKGEVSVVAFTTSSVTPRNLMIEAWRGQ